MRLPFFHGERCVIDVCGSLFYATVVRDHGEEIVVKTDCGRVQIQPRDMVCPLPVDKVRPTSVWKNLDYSVREHGWPLTEAV